MSGEQPLCEVRASVLGTPSVLAAFEGHVELVRFLGFRSERQSLLYDQIAQVYSSRGLFYTDVVLETRGGGTLRLQRAPKHKAARVVEVIRERLKEPRQMAQGRPDIPEQIRRLAGLRDQGIVSEEEFEAKKAELLKRM